MILIKLPTSIRNHLFGITFPDTIISSYNHFAIKMFYLILNDHLHIIILKKQTTVDFMSQLFVPARTNWQWNAKLWLYTCWFRWILLHKLTFRARFDRCYHFYYTKNVIMEINRQCTRYLYFPKYAHKTYFFWWYRETCWQSDR